MQTAPAERPFFFAHPALPRVLPFFVYVAFIAVWELGAALGMFVPSPEALTLLYPAKAGLAALALCLCLPRCPEFIWRDVLRGRDTFFSIGVGLAVCVLWISLDFSWARVGEPVAFMPDAVSGPAARATLLAVRFLGASVVVPLAEELFWRSFLIRFIESGDFQKIPPGRPHRVSFVLVAVLFALEHHQLLAGLVAGIAYTIVLYRTKSVAQCALAHAVTNAALGLWVMAFGNWFFW